MSFKHNLSRRLAVLVGAGVVAVIACELPATRPQTPTVAALIISPKTVAVQPNHDVTFVAVGLMTSDDTAQIIVTWGAPDGTIGNYSENGGRHYAHYSNTSTGTFKVWATSDPGGESDTATVTVTPGAPEPVASVGVTPAQASVEAGKTVQLTATPKDAAGNALPNRTVTWTSSNTSVATANSSGLVTGKAAGTATITATSEGQSGTATVTVMAAPPPVGTPDPTLLPVATTAQGPLTAAYDALNVPRLAAGSWYLDPTTGVKIYKLTSGTFPASSSSWYHDYAEGGDEVSLPYNGNTRSVLVNGSGYWLVDFTPDVGVGNARRLTGSLTPCLDMAFTFSSNPATPYYAYVSNCSSVQRIDIRTMTAAPGNGWPVNEAGAGWLHQTENDAFFTWVRGPVVVGYEPSTGTLKTQTVSNVDQPQINRNGSARQVAINTNGQEGLLLWDFTRNAIICTAPGNPGPQFNHMGALRDRWMGENWNTSAPHNYDQFLTDCSNQNLGSPASANDYYANGTWNQHPASLDDQWAIYSTQEGLVPPGSGYLAPGGMIFVTASGQRRLLGHPYNTSTSYSTLSFVKGSSDGRYVLFTSDMHGSPRSDVFLAVVPVR